MTLSVYLNDSMPCRPSIDIGAGLERGDAAHDFLRALYRLAVEARDQVAGPDAGIVGRALHQDVDDGDAAARDDAELRGLLVGQILRHEPEPAAHHMAVLRICSVTPRTRFTGIAKPMPSGPPP
jgi:hypothetical protein